MEETLSKFMSESAKRHKENSNMIKEIRASMDAAIRNQGASIKTLEIQIGKMSKVLQERGFGSLPSETKANPRDHVKLISTFIEANTTTIRRIGSPNSQYPTIQKRGSYGPQFLEAYSYGASHIDNSIPRKEKDPGSFTLPCYINHVCFDNALADLGASISNLDMPEDVKVPLILGRPFLSTAYAKIDVFKRKITLRVGDEKIIFKTRLIGETLVLNRSLDPLYGYYVELNNLNVPLELKRDQVDDLMPTIEEGEVIYEPMIDIIKTRKNESFDEEFYNSIMTDKVEYTGKNIVGAFMNVPILVKFFSVVSHFAVVENMDGYRDQDMRDIILGEPFCKASCVEARRFDGLITIHNGNDNVTYQIA
ncbi:hypothetical protein Tco_0349715 [Tanacetum coccineum]